MTFNEFKAENPDRQVDIVSEEGILLAYRNEGVIMYDLYNIDDFYVEFSYNMAHNNGVRMKIFQDTKELKPYFPESSERESSSLLHVNPNSKVNTKSSSDRDQ